MKKKKNKDSNSNNNNDNDNQQQYTSTPAKWTPSSILKIHDILLSRYLGEMLYCSNQDIPKTEKNRRIDLIVDWSQTIYKYVTSGEMSYRRNQ